MKIKIAVIGGGAAGFMASITAAQNFPDAEIFLFEKNTEVLSKVRISGGGRCNVTNVEPNQKKFSKNYPRGGSFILNLFKVFDNQATIDWFKDNSVNLKAEKDGRLFPTTDKSETIVNCLLYKARALGVKIFASTGVKLITKIERDSEFRFQLQFYNGDNFQVNSILYAAGGSPSLNGYLVLQSFDFQINKPVPSLFTFNVTNTDIIHLAGLSVNNATVKVISEKLENEGPLLITHWGFSGPAVLKLSAWGARIFSEKSYKFKILINWNNEYDFNKINTEFDLVKKNHPKKVIVSNPLFDLPSRLWAWLCIQSEIENSLLWLDISNKKRNKLLDNILNCPFEINGKSTFKEEFVTCGGIDLSEIDPISMEAKKAKGLFFAGEILDIDAITGGFNFQAAWTTGYIAGKHIGIG